MRFENDQPFSTVVASRIGGGRMTLPVDLAEGWSVVLFYRGEW